MIGADIDFNEFLNKYFFNTAFLIDPERYNKMDTEDKLQRVFGSVVDGGKTVGTHDTTNTTRGGDTTKTVKTYKTDESIR